MPAHQLWQKHLGADSHGRANYQCLCVGNRLQEGRLPSTILGVTTVSSQIAIVRLHALHSESRQIPQLLAGQLVESHGQGSAYKLSVGLSIGILLELSTTATVSDSSDGQEAACFPMVWR